MKNFRSLSGLSKNDFLRNVLITGLFLLLATVISYVMLFMAGYTGKVEIVYMMAVVLISRMTNGYLPGIIASFLSEILLCFGFTYPFLQPGFTIRETPFTFFAILAISIIISATTNHLKDQNRII